MPSCFDEINVTEPSLKPVLEKVSRGERLSRNDGLALEHSDDLHAICGLADCVRKRMHGSRVGYIVNVHVDYTNICSSGCRFCAFGRSDKDDDSYLLNSNDITVRIPEGVDEIHIVGGINPDLKLGFFTGLLSDLRDKFPDAVLKTFSAVEIQGLARRENLSISEVLKSLKDAGLGMIPGGGAEILDPEIRSEICPDKATADEYIDVHRKAHELGIPSNTTMLYGHIEAPEHRIDHLLRLRDLQDETNGIIAHIPLPYLHGANELSERAHPQSGILDLKVMAISRLLLDNVPHIKSYWRALGIRMAQVALRAGADDMDGTIGQEEIMHEAGSDAPRSLGPDHLEQIIKDAGLEPYRRDALHRPIEEVVK